MKSLAIILLAAASAAASPIDQRADVRAMRDELARSMDRLQMPGLGKPYFLSYAVFDLQRASAVAAFGALITSSASPARTVQLDLRVGDPSLDNSNASGSSDRSITLPVEDDYDAIRRALWLATDARYKSAIEVLERKKALAKAETKSPDDVGSFSKEPPSHVMDVHPLPAFDEARLAALAKRVSLVFRDNADLHDGYVSIQATAGTMIYVSSEGSLSAQTGVSIRVELRVSAQADDGMPIHDAATVWVDAPDKLDEKALVAQAGKLSAEVSAIKRAPIVDDYDGPVVFAGVASGQLLRGLLVDDLSGTPAAKGNRPGQHLAESELVGRIGRRILPRGVTITDDPRAPLAGNTAFDEEGIPSQKVTVVDDGAFKAFLMGRAPRKGFEHSNGHAFSGYGGMRAHATNLFVTSKNGLSDTALRARALAVAREQGIDTIMVIDRLDDDSEAEWPTPGVMHRVHADGRDELVRGGKLGTIPLRTLKDIIAIGSKPTVFTYAGSLTAAISSPALVFRDLDVKKPTGSQKQAPIAPRPK